MPHFHRSFCIFIIVPLISCSYPAIVLVVTLSKPYICFEFPLKRPYCKLEQAMTHNNGVCTCVVKFKMTLDEFSSLLTRYCDVFHEVSIHDTQH